MSDWQDISSAPKDGTRVRVGHHLDPSSLKVNTIMPVTGVFEGGQWECNAGFVCVDRMLRFDPTRWLPGTEEPQP